LVDTPIVLASLVFPFWDVVVGGVLVVVFFALSISL
jgi:hypothetical protein